MARRVPEPDPYSELEDQGIPDLQNGFPERAWSDDPQGAPLPGEESITVDEFGTTAEEQRRGEPLGERLSRERPEAEVSWDDADDERRSTPRAASSRTTKAPGRTPRASPWPTTWARTAGATPPRSGRCEWRTSRTDRP